MNKKIKRKHASKWDKLGELALIAIWREKMVQLRACRRNSHIHMEMASELAMQGFEYTPEELRTKMHNMTCRYRKEKQKIDSTGGSFSEWDMYEDMNYLLTPFKSYHDEGLLLDSINDISSNIRSEPLTPPSSSSITQPSSPPASKLCTSANKKKNSVEKLLKAIEKNVEKMQDEIKSTTERMLAIEEEKKEILKDFAANEVKFQKSLMDFLQKP